MWLSMVTSWHPFDAGLELDDVKRAIRIAMELPVVGKNSGMRVAAVKLWAATILRGHDLSDALYNRILQAHVSHQNDSEMIASLALLSRNSKQDKQRILDYILPHLSGKEGNRRVAVVSTVATLLEYGVDIGEEGMLALLDIYKRGLASSVMDERAMGAVLFRYFEGTEHEASVLFWGNCSFIWLEVFKAFL